MMSQREILELARSTIEREIAGVATLLERLDDAFVEAAHRLLACEGHVLVAGAGTSNPVAARLAHLLSCCGTPALFIHPGDSQHGLSGAVTERDVLIAISKGGETTEVNHLVRVAKRRGATLIALTENPNSTLGRLSHVVLHVRAPPDVDPYGMIATGSSLINAALGDALCVVLLKLRGYSLDDFGLTHPGGAVGKKLAGEPTF
ncbi:MAG: SIS domain-containing protein [Anaerolineae bacterium]|nr:MAG: SIS domain-containing protein [Anaerolineae bacterium]